MSKVKQDDPEQSRRFIALAQEQEASDAGKLKEAVKTLASRHQPDLKAKPPKRKG